MREKTIFKGYRIDSSNIALNAVTANQTFKIAPHFECKMTGDNENYTAKLSVAINSSITGDKTPFDLNVTISGAFAIGDDLAGNKHGQLRFAIETLFPYLRAFVSNLTALCGLPQFILPFIDTDQMVNSMQAQETVMN